MTRGGEDISVEYVLRAARPCELDAIFGLYEKRVRWMDEEGIRQWNATDYLTAYPPAYYREEMERGRLLVLCGEDGRPACAAVLHEADDCWADRADDPAMYVHNLAADPAARGAGARMLREIEALARSRGAEYLRLDCAADNPALNRYYESLGYESAGRCEDGPYTGVRREKKLAAE